MREYAGRPTKHEWAIGLATLTAERSTCCRRKVGCVLLNERGHVLSTGYNGVAAGLPHCNERKWRETEGPGEWVFPNACEGAKSESGTNLDACQAIHAEQNALLQCKNVYEIDTCVVTTAPCITCTKLLLNTSCSTILFVDEYANSGGQLWLAAGRAWFKKTGDDRKFVILRAL